MKNKISFIIIICLLFSITACSPKGNETTLANNESVNGNEEVFEIELTDDLGKLIQMHQPAEKIISLYSAHTENLFSLGLNEEIIGVGRSDAYPYAAVKKQRYDYRSDPEKVIAANPDMVLIRPFIEKSYPDFVRALENAGVLVVCLYPEKFEEFDDYIMNLALLTGRKDVAEKMLKEFHENVEKFAEETAKIGPKTKVYFESTETEYRTVTPDSTPAKAIKIAGGLNIASDALPIKEGTSIASYGIERILENADKIEVYVSQRGAMNAGGNYHSISIRPGFDAIKAIEDKRVFEINEKIVSSPTFRFEKGIHELARMLYPDIFDNMEEFKNDKELTKERLAKMTVIYKHKPIFTPTSSYYRKEHKRHEYGEFKDVIIKHINYDYIETAVLSGYVDSEKDMFNPQDKVTKEEFASVVYILSELKAKQNNIEIKDLEKAKKPRIIQIVVDNNLFDLDDGYFNNDKVITEEEALQILNKL